MKTSNEWWKRWKLQRNDEKAGNFKRNDGKAGNFKRIVKEAGNFKWMRKKQEISNEWWKNAGISNKKEVTRCLSQ